MKNFKKCPIKTKHVLKHFRNFSIVDNFLGQNREYAISASETEIYKPVKNSKTFPWTTVSRREKTIKRGRENIFSRDKKRARWLSQTLLIFKGKAKTKITVWVIISTINFMLSPPSLCIFSDYKENEKYFLIVSIYPIASVNI